MLLMKNRMEHVKLVSDMQNKKGGKYDYYRNLS